MTPGHDPQEPVVGPAPDGAGPVPVPQEHAADVPDDDRAEIERERDEYLDALQRLKAEFDNYRKRHERERSAAAAGAARELMSELLPLMDNLERAVEALAGHGEDVRAGVEMVRGQLEGVFSGNGVSEIPAEGAEFDPEVHEALATQPVPGAAEGQVVQVVQRGYALGEVVLRPARVVVAGGGQGA